MSKLYKTLAQAMHDTPAMEYIKRKTKWGQYEFSLDDWNAHERAVK
jgi:hypothetical protein